MTSAADNGNEIGALYNMAPFKQARKVDFLSDNGENSALNHDNIGLG